MTTSLGFMSLSEINNKPEFAVMHEPVQKKIATEKAQELINQLHERTDVDDTLGDFDLHMAAPVQYDEAEVSSNNVELELVTKINYMIQLLEETHDEKIHNITEEMVLYIFLGVFIIFMIDSFTKVGKYVR